METETLKNIRTVRSFANESTEHQKHSKKIQEHHALAQEDQWVFAALGNFSGVGIPVFSLNETLWGRRQGEPVPESCVAESCQTVDTQ